MGTIRKQAIGNTIINYTGLLIGLVNVLWLMPKGLSPEEIGLRSIILSSVFLVSPLARIGFSKVIIKFYPQFKSKEKKDHGFLFLILVIPFFAFLLITILFLVFQNQIAELYSNKAALLNKYFWFIIPLSFILMYTGIFSTYCQVKYKILFPSLVQRILMPILTGVLLYLMNIGIINFYGFMQLMVLVFFIGMLLNVAYLRYLDLLHLKPDFSRINKKMLKEMIVYGLFVIMGGVGAIVSTNISTLMIGAMEGLRNTAIFSIAYFIGTIIDIPRGSLSKITSPYIAEAWHTNKIDTIDNLYKKTALNQMIVGCFIFLLIWMNIDDIFKIIPNGNLYRDGKWIVFYIALAKVIDMTTGINTEILINSDKYKFNFVAVISFTILVVLLNYILIPIYSIEGAAIALMISFIYFNLIKFLYLLFVFKLQPFTFNFFKVLIIVGVTYLIVSLIPAFGNSLIDIFIKLAAISILFLSAIILFRASKDINAIVIKFRRFFPKSSR